MTCIWLISDTHFGHANILTFKREDGTPLRSFGSVEEMDEHMVQQWNRVVQPQDKVYHLGDVMMKMPGGLGYRGILKRLNGHKRLIRGNHDNTFKTKEYMQYFEEIQGVRVIDHIVLSHVPLHPLSVNKRWLGNVHGHLHANVVKDQTQTRYCNVSVEQIDYTPITLEQAKELLKK